MSYDAVDFLFKREFKFKYKGQKLRARPLHDGDIITERTLQWQPYWEGETFKTQAAWVPSRCVGDRVAEHTGRWYIEVLSPFYRGESDNSLTDL